MVREITVFFVQKDNMIATRGGIIEINPIVVDASINLLLYILVMLKYNIGICFLRQQPVH
jgi:hypothetical protein